MSVPSVPSPQDSPSSSVHPDIGSYTSDSPTPAHHFSMSSSKVLSFPLLSELLTADSIHTWLTKCDDRLELYKMFNPSVDLKDHTLVMCAADLFDAGSMKLSAFWRSECDSLLDTSWVLFKGCIKSQFLGTDSNVDVLQSFFSIAQGRRPFSKFLTDLQASCAMLNVYGKNLPFHVSGFLMKSALLFCCHPTLCLCVCAIPSFNLETTTLDAFISILINTWAVLEVESSFSGSVAPNPAMSLPLPSLRVPRPASSVAHPITAAERDELRSKGGCFNCGRTPQDPDWKTHSGNPYSRNCPGNPSRGISAQNVVAALFPSESTGDVFDLFGFTVSVTSDMVASVPPAVSSVYGSLPVVHHTSDSNLYHNSLVGWLHTPQSHPVAVRAITAVFHDLDLSDNEAIDDDEDDRVFGLYSY
ncbi:hypothetical protein BDP27DRAFT_1430508 [Rhodocollybia butyracea]|uniref:Uncharacterized protein n=1 Tax=Rhodocollybia butyracea TaxID=206335 RepID=A0A9P5TYR1_9AGAR|nr:hypothetical protein BDP27DRAFT_1430508 [Rhodocollybia butyracea]